MEHTWTPKFCKYPSTGQFRDVVSDVHRIAGATNPTVPFFGTVKLHGTNSAVLWDFDDRHELICQSRSHFVTPQQDNAKFAAFISKASVAMEIKRLMRELRTNESNLMVLYGEWCGNGIQSKVAISELSPMFVIFAAMEEDHWISGPRLASLSPDPATKIFNIFQFPTWTMDITFKQPELSIAQAELARLTNMVEEECPVGRYFGVHGVGEGIVWRGSLNGHHLVFKVKGDKHSVTKVKKLASVDVEKVSGLMEFVEYALTINRMEQGYNELFTSKSIVPDTKDIGPFIKWIISDIVKEELDTMTKNGITTKDIGKPVSDQARKWFMGRLLITSVSVL